MNKKTCTLTTEELRKYYLDEGRTLEEMCPIMGVKSPITVGKILRDRGIDTYSNRRKAQKSKRGMSDEEFMNYLNEEYSKGKSMVDIASEFDVTPSCIRKYFVKYGIRRRTTKELLKTPESNPNWKGGIRSDEHGYIRIYMPDHPHSDPHGYVYEHRLVIEKEIGRYLRSDEVVHHLDGNKHNNNSSNLLLMTNSEHMALHAIIRRNNKIRKK